MKYKKISDKEFVEIYHKVPRAGVDVLVVSKGGFLLTKRSIPPFKGMWHIPGGTIFFKEPVKHAIDRIAYEELGVVVKAVKQLGIIEYIDEYLDDGNRHTICNCYLAKIKSGELRGSDQDEGYKFFKKTPQNTVPEQREFIKKHLLEIKKYVS